MRCRDVGGTDWRAVCPTAASGWFFFSLPRRLHQIGPAARQAAAAAAAGHPTSPPGRGREVTHPQTDDGSESFFGPPEWRRSSSVSAPSRVPGAAVQPPTTLARGKITIGRGVPVPPCWVPAVIPAGWRDRHTTEPRSAGRPSW